MVQDEIFFDPTGAPLAAHASGALHVQDIMCLRGSHCLFDGFSLTLDPGAALAVYGANGAGKSLTGRRRTHRLCKTFAL